MSGESDLDVFEVVFGFILAAVLRIDLSLGPVGALMVFVVSVACVFRLLGIWSSPSEEDAMDTFEEDTDSECPD